MLFVFATKFCTSWFVTRQIWTWVAKRSKCNSFCSNASKQVARCFARFTYVNFLFSENNVRFYSSAVKGFWDTGLPVHRTDSYATLMSPNKGQTAVHGCHVLPGWYGCAHAWGTGQAVGWCMCAPCFKLVLLWYVYDRACLSYISFSISQRSVNFLGMSI